jgi:tol-pal system protein YbgF
MYKYLFFVFIFFFINISNAEDSLLTLKQKLDRLQREVSDLTQSVYKGSRDDKTDQNQKKDESSDLTTFDLRIYNLEKDIKTLNKNFEDLVFAFDDLKKLYEELNLSLKAKSSKDQENNLSDDQINLSNENQISDEKDISNEKDTNVKNQNSLGSIVINSEDLSEQNKELIIKKQNVEENVINLSPEEEFQLAFDLLRSQRFNEAKDSLKKFIENHKDNNLSGSAHYWLGEIYFLKKEYREAALILAEGYQKFSKSLKAPDMLYRLSDSLAKIDKIDDSCNTLIKLKEEFPKYRFLEKVSNRIIALQCNV